MNYKQAHEILVELKADLIERKLFPASYGRMYDALVNSVNTLALLQRVEQIEEQEKAK